MKEDNPLRVVLYPRVSSKKQARDGDSIDAQVSRLKRFCEEKGYVVVDVYTDAGRSASAKEDKRTINLSGGYLSIKFNLDQRPALKSIIQSADDMKFDAICFYKWDRFSRDVVFAKLCSQYLESKGIQLIPSDDSRDPLASSIMQILSEEEVRRMKSRVRSSRTERFSQSKMVGRAPFGYRFNKKTKSMDIWDKQAKVVLDVFEMTSLGCSYSEICKKYKGIIPRLDSNGKLKYGDLKPQSYYNIIKNRVYCGYVQFEGEEKIGDHQKIVKEELWGKVNG